MHGLPGRLLRGMLLTGYLVCALLAALYVAWLAQARMDFLYPFWYQAIGIDQTIARYAPKNRYRRHFQHTDRAERLRLFRELARGIRTPGYDFSALVYHDPAGRPLGRLLTPPEVRHLQDVARLVAGGERLGLAALLTWLAAVLLVLRRRWPLPGLRRQLLAGLLGIATATLAILALGPTRVFYQFHVWLFPGDNPWFFYYEDSLMSTMMRAPDLFGGIAVALLLSALVLWILMLWLPTWLQGRVTLRVPR